MLLATDDERVHNRTDVVDELECGCDRSTPRSSPDFAIWIDPVTATTAVPDTTLAVLAPPSVRDSGMIYVGDQNARPWCRSDHRCTVAVAVDAAVPTSLIGIEPVPPPAVVMEAAAAPEPATVAPRRWTETTTPARPRPEPGTAT